MATPLKTDPKEWDAAETWARDREPATLPYGLDTLDALRVAPGERMLDLAAGAGGVALAAARRGAEIVAVDWAPGMVALLAERAKNEGLTGVSALVMDGQNLDLPTASFDVACSVFGVFLFPNYRAGLAELLRVLKPGGRVGVTVWSSPSRVEHVVVLERAIHTVYPEFSGLPRPAGWEQLDSPEGLQREMETVGFRDVSILPLTHRWPIPSADWLVESTDLNRSLCDRLGPGSLDRIREMLLFQLREQYGDEPFALTSHAQLGIATRSLS